MKNRSITLLSTVLIFNFLIINWNSSSFSGLAYAADGRNLALLKYIIDLPDFNPETNFLFLEEQNLTKYKLMRRILPANEFKEYVLLDPESGLSSHLIKNSKHFEFPKIEYSKINPTKYRLRIHRAKKNFPLILHQNFHPGWKVYLVSRKGGLGKGQVNSLKNSTFSMFQNATETMNLEKGKPGETWFAQKLSPQCDQQSENDDNCSVHDIKLWETGFGFNSNTIHWSELFHWNVNGYANSWWLDLNIIKSLPNEKDHERKFYHLNPDGSVDFELVIEFWPQRLFYLGTIISCIGILICAGYLIFVRFSSFIKSKKSVSETS